MGSSFTWAVVAESTALGSIVKFQGLRPRLLEKDGLPELIGHSHHRHPNLVLIKRIDLQILFTATL